MAIEPFICDHCKKVFYFSSTPPPQYIVTIEAIRCRQKGKFYLLTDLPSHELNSMTDVPCFNWELSYQEMAEKILNYGLGLTPVEAWQRDIILNKLQDIAKWWEDANTNLINSTVISFKENAQRPVLTHNQLTLEDIEIRERNISRYGSKEMVTIDVGNWLSSVCPAGHPQTNENGATIYTDSCRIVDCEYHEKTWRPAHIIDGQHRIRGTQLPPSLFSTINLDVHKQPIPVAILGLSETEDGSSPILSSDQAKIFTEISGKATELDSKHRLFLFYVFRTGIPGADMSFPSPPATNPLRKAYEVILRLDAGTIPDNPLKDRIKVLNPRGGGTGRTSALSFDRALEEWFEQWFKTGGIWENIDPDPAAKEIVGFVNAIKNVWSGNSTVSGTPYWQPLGPPAPTGIFSHSGGISGAGGDMSAFLRVFFDLYPQIRGSVTLPNKNNFKTFLKNKLKSPTSRVGQLSWDGSGWDQIRSPDRNYNLLREVVKDILTSGGKVLYDLDHHPGTPPDLNAYLDFEPTIYEVSTSLGTVGSSGITQNIPQPSPDDIEISWRTPILSRSEIILEIRELNGILRKGPKTIDVTPGECQSHIISKSNGDYDGLPGSGIVIELRAANHKGTQAEPFKIGFTFDH